MQREIPAALALASMSTGSGQGSSYVKRVDLSGCASAMLGESYGDGILQGLIDCQELLLPTECTLCGYTFLASLNTAGDTSTTGILSNGAELTVPAHTGAENLVVVFRGAATRTVALYYRHDKSSTNDARVELYLKGRDGNGVLLGKSGSVPPGKEVSSVVLTADTSVLPSSDSYEGTMRIVYLNTDGEAATNVEIPVTVTFE